MPADEPARKWKTVFKNAILRRKQGDQIANAVLKLASESPAPSEQVARLLIGFRAQRSGGDDPLLFQYARILLQSKIIKPSDLLTALLDTSRFTKTTTSSQTDEGRTGGLPTCEERMFNILTQMHMNRELTCPLIEAHGLVLALTRWMQAVTEYEMGKQLLGGASHTLDPFSFSMYEALGSFVFAMLSSETFRGLAKQPWWRKRRKTLATEMENLDKHVLQWMNSQLLGGRLLALTTIPPFIETDDKGMPIFTDQQILNNISDLELVNSRAGLFIWLEASLCARPLADDLVMMTYLQSRYNGDNQTLALDLLTASFDVLTNALLRKEADPRVLVIKSFICNKLPLTLNIVSGFMAHGVTVEACIQLAFMSITMDVLPPISAGSNEMREKLKLTRLEFLQACALHGVVTESIIAAVLQEPPISLPKANKYIKENLLSQCANNIGRLEPLIDELGGMIGNAGAISGCIVDTINHLCSASSKDSMSLKSVCNMLIKRVTFLDIIMQYTQPANLLFPICTLLNDWTHDQDQTEFTPSYEEFASILLFVFIAVHRYGLTRADLGFSNDDNFVIQLMQGTSVSKLPTDLTDDENQQLARWIEGLYATDEHGESSGISDDVMRPCPPQAFYQLVPTLFEQSVLACKSGSLSMKTFKGGLELLVEPFLLPSLVGGLSWVIMHSWEDHGDAETLLQILDKLLKPSSSSPDTKAMHQAILGIVAKPLCESLENLNQQPKHKKEANEFMNLLNPYLDRQRTTLASKAEVDEWISSTDGGIARRAQFAIQELVSWVTNVGPTHPPKYSHRLFVTGCDAIGANAMRDAVISEVKQRTNAGQGAFALDVATSLICAPLSTSQPQLLALGSASPQMQAPPLSVREALHLYTSNIQGLLHIPTSDAEALVRLDRRAEAQLAVTHMPQLPMAIPIADPMADQVMADLGLTDDALGGHGGQNSMDPIPALGTNSGADFNNADINAVLDQSMDLGNTAGQNMPNLSTNPSGVAGGSAESIFDDLNMNIGQSGQQLLDQDGNLNLDGDGQNNAEEDIFAGLDMDLGEDFNFS
jgi:mediator of RNA polymerase II transcription subunit 5